MNVAWYLKRFIFIFIIITKLHTFIDLIILCCSFQDSVSQIFSWKVSFPWNGFVSTILWRIDRGWSQAEVIETGHGGRWSPMSNSGPIPQSRAQGWPLGTVVRHFEAHWLEHPRWKSVPSRASDRRSSQTWREDRKPPMAHFLVSPFGSVPYEKKNKNKKRSPKYWPVAWPQDAAAQCASSRSLENPFFSQRVFGFQGEGNGLGHCASVLSSTA